MRLKMSFNYVGNTRSHYSSVIFSCNGNNKDGYRVKSSKMFSSVREAVKHIESYILGLYEKSHNAFPFGKCCVTIYTDKNINDFLKETIGYVIDKVFYSDFLSYTYSDYYNEEYIYLPNIMVSKEWTQAILYYLEMLVDCYNECKEIINLFLKKTYRKHKKTKFNMWNIFLKKRFPYIYNAQLFSPIFRVLKEGNRPLYNRSFKNGWKIKTGKSLNPKDAIPYTQAFKEAFD